MKVLQILPSLEVGGVERGVIDLVRAMRHRGLHSVVVSSGGSLVGDLQKIGIPHYTLPVHRKSVLSLMQIPKLIEIIQRERVDLVHARSRVPAWLAWFATRCTGTPFVTTCHGYYSNHLLSRIMGWGKRVIVISRIVGRHMIDDFGVAPDRIRLIHRGIDLAQFPFLAPENKKRASLPVIINVGRFSPIKGQVEFLKAIHQLRRRIPRLEVWLVGSEGKGKTKYTKQIQETLRQFGLESCVKLLGTRRDIPELIAKADLLVLSTLVPEAFGRVIVEAGAVGTPVVATRSGGVLDIIDHNENGLLVAPGDVHGMADAMQRLLTEPETVGRFVRSLRQKAETHFALDKMVRETIEVYEEAQRKKKILIVKLGAMGDLILGTPSLRMIRQKFPEAHLALMVDKNLAPIVSPSPYLDEIIPVDRARFSHFKYLRKVASILRKEKFDISVDLQNTKWTHLLAFLAGIPERFGFRRGKFGFLVNRHDRSYDIIDAPVRHQFRILSKLGIKELDEELELWPDPAAENRVDAMLKKEEGQPDSKLIGLAIGSSLQWPTKRWPVESFKELALKLTQRYRCRIVLVGSNDDADTAGQFMQESFPGYLNFVGKTNHQDLVSLVKRLDILITGDTAPLHVAAAVKTKAIALFGPTDPRRHMPPGHGLSVLSKHLPCQPCYEGICRQEEQLACLKRISVEEVLETVRKQLET